MRGDSPITNDADIIDSRDVQDRIEYLEAEGIEAYEEAHVPEDQRMDYELPIAFDAVDYLDTDEAEELRALRELAREGRGYASDWNYGETLIRDSYFEDYAQEMAEDLHGGAMREASWPFNCIDWTRAARELQMDYTEIDFDGVTYWVR